MIKKDISKAEIEKTVADKLGAVTVRMKNQYREWHCCTYKQDFYFRIDRFGDNIWVVEEANEYDARNDIFDDAWLYDGNEYETEQLVEDMIRDIKKDG